MRIYRFNNNLIVFRNQFKKAIIWLPLLLCLSLIAHSQETVSGTVSDQDANPLIGVNVQVKGTNTGTATDFDGHYEINDVSENAILVFSYIGYQTQEVLVNGENTLDITMSSDAALLDEVVV